MKKYEYLSDTEKQDLLKKEYINNKASFQDIAEKYNTYSNKVRRDAIKFNIEIRSKSEAQKNVLSQGKASHPTKGKTRTNNEKQKIGMGVMKSWENLDDNTLEKRKQQAKANWENLSDDTKAEIIASANVAVRQASKTGSKLEKFLLSKLLKDGFKTDFHKEQTLLNTKLQIDIFLPQLDVAIEVDGPSHYEPVWGEDALKRNQSYDKKKTGLILGKGLVLIRVKQIKDFSPSRSEVLYGQIKDLLDQIQKKFPDVDNRLFVIGE